jgi:hypothetical protein
MTSTLRVSEVKNGKSHGNKSSDGKPAEGTKIRAAYDALRRGETVSLRGSGCTVAQLRDFYGMELERVYNTEGHRGLIGSRLVGEWDGPYYIPVERIVSSLMEPA